MKNTTIICPRCGCNEIQNRIVRTTDFKNKPAYFCTKCKLYFGK